MGRGEPQLVIDWQRPAARDPQSSLERYAPGAVLEASRAAREASRRRPAAPTRRARQMDLDAAAARDAREVVELELKHPSRLTSLYIAAEGPARPAHRVDEEIREALLRATAEGAQRDDAVIAAARECAVPLGSLALVEALLDDLVLEGAVTAYGDTLFTKKASGRKRVALEVEEQDLFNLLSRGHRVLELK